MSDVPLTACDETVPNTVEVEPRVTDRQTDTQTDRHTDAQHAQEDEKI